jgi:Tol biopolymer transport system component
MNRMFLMLAVLALAVVVTGCGGSGTNAGDTGSNTGNNTETTQTIGNFATRIVGTAQSPVTIYSGAGAVTGISGASFTDVASTDRFNVPIVYVSDEDGDDEIWAMSAIGTLRTQLTKNTGSDSYPKLSPDGSKIVFASDRAGNNDIYTMNTDGSGVTQLTTNGSGDIMPAWSPDGTKIVFASARDGSYEIYTANANGTESGVVQVTNGGADTSANSYPVWSPDGTKVAYHANRVSIGNYECFIKNADGTGSEMNLTNNAATDQYPSWSPDGSRMVIASTRGGAGYDIWTINAFTGASPLQLASTAGTDWEPSWSPDGTKVYFSSSRDDLSAPISYELYSVPSSGGTETRLTTDTDTSQEKAHLGSAWQTKYIGTDGRLGTGCAGFLFGQAGTTTTSVLSFDTVGSTLASRAAARVTSNSPGDTNLSNFFFTITTTVGISNIKYVNSFGAATLFPNIINISVPSGSTNALIGYSGVSTTVGQVTSVLPYAANRSTNLKTIKNGDLTTVSAHFTAVFDATGKNIAPNGASSVTLDEKKGELVTFN